MQSPSMARTLLSVFILACLPIMTIAHHRHVESQDAVFEIPVQLSATPDSENIWLLSEINALDLDELTGTNHVNRGDTVFVHMARGPMNIAYPFAITPNQPQINNASSFSLRGVVTEREGQVISIHYNFENFLPSSVLKTALETENPHKISALLAVSPKAIARLTAIRLDGELYPYRVMEKPELFGFIQNGARIIPIK